MANNQHYPQGDVIQEDEDYYHSSYMANASTLSTTIVSNEAFLQQQLKQTHNISTPISSSATSTNEPFSNIFSTYNTSLPKYKQKQQQQQLNQQVHKQQQQQTLLKQSQQQNLNSPLSNKNSQSNPLANLFPLTPLLETPFTKNINTSMEIDPPTTAQDSSITDQLTDKNTNQT